MGLCRQNLHRGLLTGLQTRRLQKKSAQWNGISGTETEIWNCICEKGMAKGERLTAKGDKGKG